jgi:hypothetical protein
VGRQDRVVERGKLCGAKDAPAEEIEVRPTVHLPLQQLEPVHLALRLTVAPGHCESGTNRRFIGQQTGCEPLEFLNPTRPYPLDPGVELGAASLPQQVRKIQTLSAGSLDLFVLHPQLLKVRGLLIVEPLSREDAEQGGLPCGRALEPRHS